MWTQEFIIHNITKKLNDGFFPKKEVVIKFVDKFQLLVKILLYTTSQNQVIIILARYSGPTKRKQGVESSAWSNFKVQENEVVLM